MGGCGGYVTVCSWRVGGWVDVVGVSLCVAGGCVCGCGGCVTMCSWRVGVWTWWVCHSV